MILLTAASSFKKLTEEMLTWEDKTTFEHRSYLDVMRRNYIQTNIATYKEIKDHPMALTHRCSPVSHYYITIVQDSPGYQERPNATGATMGDGMASILGGLSDVDCV